MLLSASWKAVKVTHKSTKFVNPVLIEEEGIRTAEMNIDNGQFISDDDEDLFTSAALGKYQSDDESEDEDGDEDDSEGEPSKESNLPAQAVHIALGDKSRYFQAPTNDEIQSLKEVSELFKSNIFKLEVCMSGKVRNKEIAFFSLRYLLDSFPLF